MSLIEQAAKRLEELRRAGTTLHEEAPGEVAETNEADRVPTPEAVVRALEAQAQPQPIKTGTKPRGPQSTACRNQDPCRDGRSAIHDVAERDDARAAPDGRDRSWPAQSTRLCDP